MRTQARSAKLPPRPKRRRWPWLVLALAFPVLACLGWWGWTIIYHQLTFHPTGWIAFGCAPGGVCLVKADGSERKELIRPASNYSASAWSPDGAHIAFLKLVANPTVAQQQGEPSALHIPSVMNADGSSIIELTDHSGSGSTPSWSPDSERLVFSRFTKAGDSTGIYSVRRDGSETLRLADFGIAPSWSFEGKSIAFADEQAGLYRIEADGTNLTQLVSDMAVKSIAWAPDRLHIAFTAYRDASRSTTSLYLLDLDGSRLVQLAEYAGPPVWSPDGTKIAFQCPTRDICIVNADGTGLPQFTHSQGKSSVAWSPDGQYLVYVKKAFYCLICNESGQLWIMKADGSQQTQLTDGPLDFHPVWRPVP